MREYFTLYTTDQFHILRTVLDTFYEVPTRRILCNNQELLQLVIISFTLTHNRTNAAKALAHKNLTEKGHHNEKWRFIQVETSPMPPHPTPRTRLYTFKRIESDSIQIGLNIHILFEFDVFDIPNTQSVANVTPWRCFTSVLVPEKLYVCDISKASSRFDRENANHDPPIPTPHPPVELYSSLQVFGSKCPRSLFSFPSLLHFVLASLGPNTTNILR